MDVGVGAAGRGCALLTSALTAVLGFGGGVVLLAVLVAFVEPLVAIPLQAAIQVVSNGTRTVVRRDDVDWSIVGRTSLLLLPAGALTLPLARRAPEAALQVAIALGVLAATWLPERRSRPLPAPSPWGWVGLGGVHRCPEPRRRARPDRWPPRSSGRAPATASASSGRSPGPRSTGHLTKLVLFGSVGLLPVAQAPAAAAGIVGVVAGTWIGSAILDRMSEHRFDRLYLVAITAIAVWLLVDAAPLRGVTARSRTRDVLHQLDLALAAADLRLVDQPDAGGVGLLLDHLRFEGFQSRGAHQVGPAAGRGRERRRGLDDLTEVLGLALEVLLAVGVAGRRGREHDDPGRAPSTPASHEPSVLTTSPSSISFESSPRYQTFPSRVLGVPVEGVLHQLPSDGHPVAHDGRGDPHDHAGRRSAPRPRCARPRRRRCRRRPRSSPAATAGRGCR